MNLGARLSEKLSTLMRIDVRGQGISIGGTQTNVFYGAATSSPAEKAADRLADVMRSVWQDEARRRGLTEPAPIAIRWQWASSEIAARRDDVTHPAPAGIGPTPLPGPVRHQGRTVLGSGSTNRLHDEVYARLSQGRLVIVGGPGAGKTGAMILLLLAALRHRQDTPSKRAEIPVPVWLTLGGWNPDTTPLRQWARTVILRDHPYLDARTYGRDAASELLDRGRVALFLDGLDEMPPAARGLALERLDQEVQNLRVVLTSRRDEFKQALDDGHLHNAAVIELQPVRARAATSYLVKDHTEPHSARWDSLAAHLAAHPASPVAVALTRPLYLSLARSTYRRADPLELLDPQRFPTAAAVREHLIDRILLDAYPDPRLRASTEHWLRWIAFHQGESRDLAWWRIVNWVPRWRIDLNSLGAAVFAGLLTSLATMLALTALASADDLEPWIPISSHQSIQDYVPMMGIVGGFLLWLGTQLISRRLSTRSTQPLRLQPRLPRRGELLRLTWITIVAAIVVGVTVASVTRLGSAVWSALDRARLDGLAVEFALLTRAT